MTFFSVLFKINFKEYLAKYPKKQIVNYKFTNLKLQIYLNSYVVLAGEM